jgi:hypothetical protein
MKFKIATFEKTEQFDGNTPIYGSGNSVIKKETVDRFAKKMGTGIVRYRTGLAIDELERSKQVDSITKAGLIERFPRDLEKLEKEYGKANLDPENRIFWEQFAKLQMTNDNNIYILDDDNSEDLLVKMGIYAGAYPAIAGSAEIASEKGLSYYLVELEAYDEEKFEKEVGLKLEATGELYNLNKKGGKDALLWFTWYLSDQSKGFTKTTTGSKLVQELSDYIDGKLTTTQKKDCPKKFIETIAKWKSDKDTFIKTCLFKAGLHFGDLYKHNSTGIIMVSSNQAQLGTDVESSLKTLDRPENLEMFINLKEAIETKLNK